MQKFMKFALCSTALCGVSAPAFAQGAGAGDNPSQGGLADIVVTARKISESLQDVPIAITAVSDETMRNLQIANYSDLSRITPSLFITRYNSNPASPLITIRGVAQQDVILNIDTPIGVYVDGVYYPHSFGLDASMIDIQRVEVLKGPQGTLFGRNTTGGAISVTSRDPDLNELGGFIDARAGNYGAVNLNAAVNVPLIKDKLALRMVGSQVARDGYGHDSSGRSLNDERSQFIRAKLRWEPSDSLRVVLSGDYQKLTNHGSATHLTGVNDMPSTVANTPAIAGAFRQVAAQSGLTQSNADLLTARNILASYIYGAANGPTNFYDSVSATPQSNFFAGRGQRGYFSGGGVGLDINYDFSDSMTLRSITSFRSFKREDLNELDGTPFNILFADSYSNSDYYAQELQLVGKMERFDWIVGAYANIENAFEGSQSESVPAVNPNNPNNNIAELKQTSEALFAQATYSFTDELRFTGGARYTWESKDNVSGNNVGLARTCSIPVSLLDTPSVCKATFKNNFSDWSYLATLDFKPSERVLLYAKTSRGFKGGGQNIRGSGNIASFAPFAPETVTDYELGFKTDMLNRRLRVNGAVYYSDYNDIQRSARILAPGGAVVSLVTNAAKARIKGAELEVTAQPVPELTLGFSGSVTDAKYKTFNDAQFGDRSREVFPIPKYMYAVTGVYEIPTSNGTVKLAADWSWRSRVVFAPAAIFNSQVAQASYGLLNSRVSYEIEAMGVEIAGFVKNLTKKEYYAASGSFDNSLGFNVNYVGSPRTYGIQVIKRFGGG
ncbi:hypothetical protein C1T17_02655 [Sphingobium sp. SCG-1]|uniref:TonB-dependent receptor n=1 Tax=Sphingobium sp. SCG-1 TaxID=2072936 RepID=UPI000CD69A5A|nr:TonB-dependent receptor [Sphingobium sp. SCG-1]AUW57147.1 hypothetical protein C1T17_02655 [Sphingobium sp. SCG-1]